MLRFLRRKLVLCLLIIMGFMALKEKIPQWGRMIGDWIGGGQHIAEVFHHMEDAFYEGNGIAEAVEVFHDGV